MSDAADVAAAGAAPNAAFEDQRRCWRVTAGRLDLFAVPVDAAGEPVETGRYLFTVEPGGLGFGIAPCPLADGVRLAIRARGRPRAAMEALPPDAFGAKQNMAEAVERWLNGLADCLGGADAANLVARPDRDRQTAAEGDHIGSPQGSLLWLDPQSGALLLLGREGIAALPGDPPLPVPSGCWALASEPTAFSAWTTAALIGGEAGRDRFRPALERANACFLALIADEFARRRASEAARIAGRLRQSASAFAAGLGHIGAVLRRDSPPSDLGAAGDALFAAAGIVAARQKIALEPVRRMSADPGEYLEAICRAARINLRPVTLERDWFRHDNGPLLGFAGGVDGAARPLALLPRGTAGYEAVDPERGSRFTIGASEARNLLPTAYMFYRGFAPVPISARTLIRFGLKGMGRDLTRVLGMGVLGGLLSLVLPVISDPLFGDVLPRADVGTLAAVVLALAMAALGSAGFALVRSFSLLRVQGRMEADVQAAVWDRLLRLPPGFFRNYETGDLADRVMSVTTIRSVVTSAISSALLDAMFSVVSFALMFWYSGRLALIAAGLALVAVLLTAALTALQIPHQRALMRDLGRVGGLTYQLLTAIGKLRVAGAEARAFGRWAALLAQQRGYAYRARRVGAAQQTLVQVFPPMASIVLYVAMIELGTPVADSEVTVPVLTLGAYMAFSAAFGQFMTALMSAVSGLTSLVTIVPLYERVRPILGDVPETRDDAEPPGLLAGDIEFRRVTFRYLDHLPPVLDDVSFHIRPGEYVAIVGPSGSGKSTILRLALGFETAQSGGIFFDRKNISTLDLGQLRRQIGVVLQNAGLLAGNLYENIAGSLPIPMEEAWEAARLAGLDADIRAMPMGMYTRLSDAAPMLSGGQRQRVIIARALVRKPRILIFDEATSALDNRTQAIVTETLAELALTRIVIAHRLSTIRGVDRILVLDRGRIVETGGYDELLARGGRFSELARRQLL